ncbi:MAG: hypothetical protein ACRD72_14660 [Candidatus Angelobacter sp.]
MRTSDNHLPFFEAYDPSTTRNGQAVNFPASINTIRQPSNETARIAIPAARTSLAHTARTPSDVEASATRYYSNYHNVSKKDSPEILIAAKYSLPLGLFRVPRRPRPARLVPYLPPIDRSPLIPARPFPAKQELNDFLIGRVDAHLVPSAGVPPLQRRVVCYVEPDYHCWIDTVKRLVVQGLRRVKRGKA